MSEVGRIVDDRDPSIVYDPRDAWVPFDGEWGEHAATDTGVDREGASARLQFTGTGVGVTCTIFENNSTAIYTVDQEQPVRVFILERPEITIHQTFFERKGLPRGAHTLTVRHVSGYTVLDYFTVYGEDGGGQSDSQSIQPPTQPSPSGVSRSSSSATSQSSTTSTSATSFDTSESNSSSSNTSAETRPTKTMLVPSPSPSEQTPSATNIASANYSQSSKEAAVGAIVGGVLGGVAFLLVILAVVAYRRRPRTVRSKTSTTSGTSGGVGDSDNASNDGRRLDPFHVPIEHPPVSYFASKSNGASFVVNAGSSDPSAENTNTSEKGSPASPHPIHRTLVSTMSISGSRHDEEADGPPEYSSVVRA